jgi:hypothetical protein
MIAVTSGRQRSRLSSKSSLAISVFAQPEARSDGRMISKPAAATALVAGSRLDAWRTQRRAGARTAMATALPPLLPDHQTRPPASKSRRATSVSKIPRARPRHRAPSSVWCRPASSAMIGMGTRAVRQEL